MSLHILALIALIPFALLAFLYREAHVDLRPTLVWLSVLLSLLAVVGAVLVDL